MIDNLLEPEADLPNVDPDKDYFKELVGEGKKFKSPEDLARGKFESDQFIEILKKRQDEMRADYLKLREDNTAKAKLEDLIDQLSKKNLASNEDTEVKEEKQPEIDIESLVS